MLNDDKRDKSPGFMKAYRSEHHRRVLQQSHHMAHSKENDYHRSPLLVSRLPKGIVDSLKKLDDILTVGSRIV
jgi:hypothetical protein